MNLVSRRRWGARTPKCVSPLPPADITTLVFHYSAADADEQADHAKCAGRVRGIQTFHMDGRGWCDIAYSFVVCRHGYTFAGRGWDTRTAATGPANGFSLAVCFLGNDTPARADVTPTARVELEAVARRFRARYGPAAHYKGHRDYMATTCPGDELYRFIHSPRFIAATLP